MTKVEEDVEMYLEKISLILEEKKRIIAEARERDAQVITATATSIVSAEQHTQQKDKFQALSELKPKYLEKEANLLELKNWIQQAKKLHRCRTYR